jgi:myo-inositol-1(or 4)-monophosphatase
MGAAALDICSVASGSLDAYVDFSRDAHSPWDYLGGLLVCQEAGAVVAEPWGRQLVTRDEGVRRSVVAAATAPLLDEALALRLSAG